MDYLQYKQEIEMINEKIKMVLNLVINGLPSILTYAKYAATALVVGVLNLVINGLPSILHQKNLKKNFQIM